MTRWRRDRIGARSRVLHLAQGAGVAALLLGSPAYAADLGGNCCADLEERVAELEATTARKGNRKVKLTVSGHVNEAVLFWDDGSEKNAYVVTNNAARTRFRFVGDAKINNDWSAGYLLEIGVRYANSANRQQTSDRAGGNANQIDIRHSAWWLDSKQLGRLWVGKTSSATDGITEINLSNSLIGTPDEFFTAGNGFRLRTGNGGLSSLSWQGLAQAQTTTVGEGDRNNVVKYVSPTLLGFTFSAAWGEDDFWDVALRYAGEFSGFRLAAGVGYRDIRDFNASADGMGGCANLAGTNTQSGADCHSWGTSGSVMHVSTGLYVAGSYGEETDDNRKKLFGANVKDTARAYYIQGGIERKWLPFGKTTLYGEYWHGDFGAGLDAGGVRTVAAGDPLNSIGAAGRIASSEIDMWGLGIQQSVDAAAMDFYIGYKNFSGEAKLSASGSQAGSVNARGIEDFQMVIAGAIIRF